MVIGTHATKLHVFSIHYIPKMITFLREALGYKLQNELIKRNEEKKTKRSLRRRIQKKTNKRTK